MTGVSKVKTEYVLFQSILFFIVFFVPIHNNLQIICSLWSIAYADDLSLMIYSLCI